MTYAKTTEVSSERSRAEIERTLRRYGVTSFAYGYDDRHAVIGFVAHGRNVRFVLPMPSSEDREFTHTPSTNNRRSTESAARAYEQAVRSRWRALGLIVKAKLEAVETGIVSFETEFLAHIVLPDGSTVGDTVVPGVRLAYATGEVPALLPSFPSRPELPR